MIKRSLTITSVISLLLLCSCSENINWQPAETPLLTSWAADIDPSAPWDHYPRPGMVREEWINLNGIWDFEITLRGNNPADFSQQILVPYPVESALSGIAGRVTDENSLWYRRTVKIPRSWKGREVLLHFEASDWETRVLVDGTEAGIHRGGYDPFSFNITKLVTPGKEHEIRVEVWDPTDKGNQPRGKQVTEPRGIWYTPTSGIWQTVWLEPVPAVHFESFRITTDIDSCMLTVDPQIFNLREGLTIRTLVTLNGEKVAESEAPAGEPLRIEVPGAALWEPGSPVLYDLEIVLSDGEKDLDRVGSYTGFRKISLGDAGDGFTRILLNDRFLFQNGPLDQGFWPDGLYTPPTEEAMVYDLEMTRKMGFNMLRKHVKVENRRFYYWCDRLGLLVWQDMPSGDKYIWGDMPDIDKDPDDDLQFRQELAAMIATKYNSPSIIVWVPFNEGWGQYNTGWITDYIRALDPSRLVNSASGWTDRGTGDMLDIHHYPEPVCPDPETERAIVLGEFGGLGLPVEGHTWEQRNWGYRNMSTPEELLQRFELYYSDVYRMAENGLSAVIYTQTTDVETETNGLMTYDRAIVKMGEENIRLACLGVTPPRVVNDSLVFTGSYLVDFIEPALKGSIRYTTDGSQPGDESALFAEPFLIEGSTTLKAIFISGDRQSRIATFDLKRE